MNYDKKLAYKNFGKRSKRACLKINIIHVICTVYEKGNAKKILNLLLHYII